MGNQKNRFALFLILILPLLHSIIDFQVVETGAQFLATYNSVSVTYATDERGELEIKAPKITLVLCLKKKGPLVMQSFSAHPIQPPDTLEET